ncbi:MAG: ATP-dependent DNA ligase [Armatimonadota bacterium]|nr:ATP-dependent DNA ligase [Armatimonadota bacterium]MDR5702169.1 ATP-dependent DNA ligase [Armatimonadota bacterium]
MRMGSFRELAEVMEAIASTASKLEKIALLGEYLNTLEDADLEVACTYLTGSPFPAGDPRKLNIGWSALVDLILEISGASLQTLDALYLKHGDLGKVAEELLSRKVMLSLFPAPSPPLTIQGVREAFETIAALSGPRSRQHKMEILRRLLLDATPLEAKYLVKIITSDLRIGLREGLLEEAIARTWSVSLEEVRRANMLLSHVGLVAVMARRGQIHTASLMLFRPLRFMLAETIFSAEEAFQDQAGALLVEEKYDGIRVQVHKEGDRLAIYSRTLDDITASFPELHANLLSLASCYILDGEIVAWRDGPLPFYLLQQRLRREDPATLLQEIPVVLFAFDLLHLDGQDLLSLPLEARRKALERLNFRAPVYLSRAIIATTPQEVTRAFREAREKGNEGVMLKRLDAPYTPGKRGRLWMKWKEELATLDVVVVAVEHGHGKRANVLSDYTFAIREGEHLRTIGKAYSGLTDEEIERLTEWFRAHTIRDLGRVKLVEPKIVLEVAFDAIQRSDRHDSGFALRFPRIKRIREDKSPEEISTVEDVRRIYEHQRTKLS